MLANASQQVSAILLFLLIPKLLSIENYAIVVFVGVLLSFASLGDLGFSFVYSRIMPSKYHDNDRYEIDKWSATTVWTGVVGTFFIGIVLTAIFYVKFSELLLSLLLFLLLPLIAITGFITNQHASREDFHSYKNLIIYQSCFRVLAIPFTLAGGILGWFLSQFFIYVIALKKLLTRDMPSIRHYDFDLFKKYLHEGILLALTFLLWSQLISSGRLLAAFNYDKTLIADYGLMSAGYQIFSSLLLAIFTPCTVRILKTIHIDEIATTEFIFKSIYLAIPIIFILVYLGEIVAPTLFKVFFAKYHYDAIIFKSFLYSLILFPIIITFGNIYIAKQKTTLYIALLGASLLLTFILFKWLLPDHGFHAAAFAQFGGITCCSILMLLVACYKFKSSIIKKAYKLSILAGMLATIFILEYGIIN